MKTIQSDSKNNSSREKKSHQVRYHKPSLQKYGSITTLTTGLGGSVVDTSGPGTQPR